MKDDLYKDDFDEFKAVDGPRWWEVALMVLGLIVITAVLSFLPGCGCHCKDKPKAASTGSKQPLPAAPNTAEKKTGSSSAPVIGPSPAPVPIELKK